jgi:formate dehydrogenase gamma subunit
MKQSPVKGTPKILTQAKALRVQSMPSLRRPLAKQFRKARLTSHIVITQRAAIRIFHWGFAFSLAGLILTGLVLHRPPTFLALAFSKIWVAHITFAWLGMSFWTFRIVDMILYRDTSLLPTWQDIKSFPSLLAYYLFLRDTPPPSGKYNSGQKMVFFSWLVLFAFICFISMASYWAGQHMDWAPRLLGGFQVLRWIKFTALIYFASTIPLHFYLFITQDPSRLQAMVTGYEQKKPN